MMIMEDQEEVVRCKDQLQIIKGKRTKRPRLLSPLTLAMASSTSTSSVNGGESGRSSDDDDDSRGFDRAIASPTTTTYVEQLAESSTKEEEDMAYCLILLAQGRQTRKPSEPAATTSKTGIYVHQCKTCNRCFPSFQALGGHRSSHKKPKVHNEENSSTKGLMFVTDQDDDVDVRFNNINTTLSLQIMNKALSCNNNSKSKVHECSICGAEFSSGQALGGHMRRHRTILSAANVTKTLSVGTRSNPPESEDHQSSKKPRTVLQLDLNLPAPEDGHHKESKFPFASNEKLLVFSTSSLVDCHY